MLRTTWRKLETELRGGLRHREMAKASGQLRLPAPVATAPVFDPTGERRLETEPRRGVRHRHCESRREQLPPSAYRNRASRRLYPFPQPTPQGPYVRRRITPSCYTRVNTYRAHNVAQFSEPKPIADYAIRHPKRSACSTMKRSRWLLPAGPQQRAGSRSVAAYGTFPAPSGPASCSSMPGMPGATANASTRPLRHNTTAADHARPPPRS